MAVVTTAFLYGTARADENECKLKFGEEYGDYMKRAKCSSRMYIRILFPFFRFGHISLEF